MIGKQLKTFAKWASRVNTEVDTYHQNQQRRHVLDLFFKLVLFSLFILTLVNLGEWVLYRAQKPAWFIFLDLLSLGGFAVLMWLNRKGQTNLAAHLSLTVVMLSSVLIFKFQDLEFGFFIFAIAILMSSFVLHPNWTFFYATLAIVEYSFVYFTTKPDTPYEYLTVISLYLFAGISYLIASRYNTAMNHVHASEERLRTLFDRVPVGLYRTTADGKILEANPTLLKMFGYQDLETFQQINVAALYANKNEHTKWMNNFTQHALADEFAAETQLKRRDGDIFWAADATRAVHDENGQLLYYEGSLTDISKRKRIEEALLKSEERFRHIFENATVGIYRTTPYGKVLLANQTLLRMLGYDSLEELSTRNLDEDGFEPEYPRSEFQKRVEAEGEIHGLEAAWQRKDGTTIYIRESAKVVRDQNGDPLYYEGTVEDVTERKLAEDKVQEQIEQLTALRKIDTTISSSTDLRLCLNTILNETIRLLDVDAADIMLLNSNLYNLECVASVGFRSEKSEKRSIRLGAGEIGKAALNNKKFVIHNMKTNNHKELSDLSAERFTCYHCAPLVVKGKIQGVIETYNRQHDSHPREGQNFLETLAGQTAIAIENARLFENLQQSNFELTIAYDQTIEGWSQALDLRERVLGNHSQNVTQITVQLAQAMGYKDKDLLYIRYGALLHDIGKMGIPDQILLKPDKLTHEEWEIVKQHPQIGYDLLKNISYLRPTLDIPYAHHERWDGSGYPRGLAGDDIPKAARILAIADVYEALQSDRPYRKRWTKQDALEYIKEQSGKQFDPAIVKVFLREFGSK